MIGNFTSPLETRYHPELKQWEVLTDFWFQRPDGEQLRVPKGFITDLASTENVPMFPSDDVYNQAAVLHDYLYAAEIFPRWLNDEIFKEALTAIHEVPRWKIPIMVFAVRVFGGFTYKNHTLPTVIANRHLSGLRDFVSRPLWPDCYSRF